MGLGKYCFGSDIISVFNESLKHGDVLQGIDSEHELGTQAAVQSLL